MSSNRQSLGRWGENLATEYLSRNGYTILQRNLHTPYGEIDIIAKQKESIVFVEVKTRRSDSYGYPEEAITPAKQSHLLAAAQSYLQSFSSADVNWRVDVIAIRCNKNTSPEIIHFENVLSE